MNPYNRYNTNTENRNQEVLEQLYPKSCLISVEQELRYLLQAFGALPLCGSGHPVPCNTWRTERILHPTHQEDAPRFTNRIHLFEAPSRDERPVARGQLGPGQRYLGYVSLRPLDRDDTNYTAPIPEQDQFFLRYTATATLAPPGFMLRPRYHVITCIAGPAEGVMPFRAVPFSNPEQFSRETRAKCMHAALHAALLLKANVYHAVPLNSQDMVTVLWQRKNDPNVPLHELQKSGLRMQDALELLTSEEVRAGGVLEAVKAESVGLDVNLEPSDNERQRICREALQYMTDYLANGIPLILEVGKPPKTPQDRNDPKWEEYFRMSHAWLVVGFRLMTDPDEECWPLPDDGDKEMQRIDVRELPSRFVVHDQLKGPYYRVYARKMLDLAWVVAEYPKDEPPKEPGVRFLAVLPRHARIGVQFVRRNAMIEASSTGGEVWTKYLMQELGLRRPTRKAQEEWPLRAQYVVRLVRAREIAQRYLAGPSRRHPAQTDPEQLLRARTALQRKLASYPVPTLHREPNQPTATERHSPIAWWWCVEIRHPKRSKNRRNATRRAAPGLVYLWPIHQEERVPPVQLTFAGTQNGQAQMQLCVEGEEPLTYEWFADDADAGGATEGAGAVEVLEGEG